MVILLLILAFASFRDSAGASVTLEKNCAFCHQTRISKTPKCVRCHLNKPHKSWNNLYAMAPQIDINHKGEYERYNKKILVDFLKNPIKRTTDKGHMFPLTPEQIQAVLPKLSGQTHQPYLGEKKRIPRGRSLYNRYQCSGCHDDARQAPLLRIGMPLLTLEYWKRRLSGKVTKVFHRYPTAMPTFQLTEEEIKNIFSYAAFDRGRLRLKSHPKPPEFPKGEDSEEIASYLHVGGCVHCHYNGINQREVTTIFGAPTGHRFNLDVDQKRQITTFDPKFMKIFQMEQDCHSSPVLDRLQERVRELKGQDNPSIRGMPLAKPALSQNQIQKIRDWSQKGCPISQENTCEPCKSKDR